MADTREIAEQLDELTRTVENTHTGLILLANGAENSDLAQALRMLVGNMDAARQQVLAVRTEAFAA